MYKVQRLTINPLYQALICCLVKFVLSIRNVISSLDSFLLDFPPIFCPGDVFFVGGDVSCSANSAGGSTAAEHDVEHDVYGVIEQRC